MVSNKICKAHDSTGYAYNMTAQLSRDRKCVTAVMIDTHATITQRTTQIKIMGQNLLLFPDLFDDFSC
jgi:hypothetical protein